MENLFLTDQDVIKIFKEHLKIESRVIPIEELFKIRNKNKIDFKPYYQRNYVWNNEKASYFIESLLIGTEIPPLIFFHGNNNNIEIIDGRQRFETIYNFLEDKLTLNEKGLIILKSLDKIKYSKLAPELLTRFLESKIRVIDFKLINEPKLDIKKEDLIKKEIFRRYNSGITPLRRSDVDKAVFIDDPITKKLKDKFVADKDFYLKNVVLFYPKKRDYNSKSTLEELISKIRLLLVLHLIPTKYYSTLKNRKDIMNMLYNKYSEEQEDLTSFLNEYEKKISYINNIKNSFSTDNYNQLMSECLFWVFNVIENEGYSLKDILDVPFIESISKSLENNCDIYSEKNSHFFKEFNQRYRFTLEIFEKKLMKDFKIYLDLYNAKEVRDNIDLSKTDEKAGILENSFITKPAPMDMTIESIIIKMERNNFKVRPIYQRSEVMNISKASSLIESILLDIKLPPIFIYKNKNSVSEVVDGQQRILAILGFIGKSYKDENGNIVKSNKNDFKLKNLTILKELNGLKFSQLEEKYQNRILDFNLFIVEIDSSINENFNPIDLFIRLNSKPYPIKENTFEMWNSYVDIEIIKKIKENTKKIENWFYIKKPESDKRMENEELYTTLVYINYMQEYQSEKFSKIVDIHKRDDRINCRISDKKDISKVLNYSSIDENEKEKFIASIKNIEAIMLKIKTLLIRSNIEEGKLDNYLESELDKLFYLKARRRLQNFYLLYPLIKSINLERVREKREELFNDILETYKRTSNLKENEDEEVYFEKISLLDDKWTRDKRKIILTLEEKKQILLNQKNFCPLCNSVLFHGEDIEVDHIIPISMGGKDKIENLQITHKDCNRKKGTKNIKKYLYEPINLEDIEVYLSKHENENLEFKSTLSWNIKGKLRDTEIENSVLKTIAAFNNFDGGVLLIGIDDNKNILGLDYDFKEGNLKDVDKFENHLRNIIKERLIAEQWYISKNFKISFENIENKIVCIIKIDKGTKPIYTKDNKFFIRNGNRTIQLELSEIVQYVKNNFEE
ncbi:MAG: DUF262 domain-containing protein [Candidatus Nanoarchaeia archaeon]